MKNLLVILCLLYITLIQTERVQSTEGISDLFISEFLVNFNNRNENNSGDGIKYFETSELPIQKQFSNDVLILFKTLFPETRLGREFTESTNWVLRPTVEKSKKINESLKRILLAMSENGLHYGSEENQILNSPPSDSTLWPYPLASILCHGARTLFLFDKRRMSSKDFTEFFFYPNKELLAHRSTASHKVEYDKKQGKIKETKIQGEAAVDWIKSIFNEDLSPHYGMNIPLGGIGNLWPQGNVLIGAEGFGVKGKDSTDKDPLQHGHMYVRIDNLSASNYGSILFGIEEEAPDFKGMFSSKVHNFLNAFSAPTTSVCGGKKWPKLKDTLSNNVPNQYGGKVVFFDQMPSLKLINKINSFTSEDLQKKVWWIILSCNSTQFRIFKDNFLSLNESELSRKLNSF